MTTANQLPVSLEDVVVNSELVRRPCRAADYEAENEALKALAQTIADSPQTILQKLVETALRLCRAGTAGISLLEKHNGEEVFRWEALAGVYADRLNNTMPRNASPCGTTIDRNTTQLMHMAERFFPALKAEPPVVEALLIPFHVENKPIGTVWIVSHDERRKFDREDERIVRTLAQFASAGWQLWKARATAEAAAQTEQQRTLELAVTNEALQVQVNERKRAEEKLQQLNQELEQRVRDRTHELEDANRRLRETQVVGTLGTAAAKIIHDLTNPLNAISTVVQLQERYLARRSERLQELIAGTTKDLKEETARVHTLIGELRQFSRPSEIKLEPVDLAEMVAEVIREAMFLHNPSSPVEFEQQLATDLPFVMGDDEKLKRVLFNLCKNALEAMPKGGRLAARCFSEGKNICLEVEDTGCGIPKGMNIFEPFTTSKPNGWGLGLSIVQQIVSAHNGTIEYVSEPGKGTTFKICLPSATS